MFGTIDKLEQAGSCHLAAAMRQHMPLDNPSWQDRCSGTHWRMAHELTQRKKRKNCI
jgi:hypothetical protein